MSELKLKKEYINTQIKMFNNISLLDDLLTKHIEDSTSVSYKKILNLSRQINKLLLYSTRLKNDIICLSLVG